MSPVRSRSPAPEFSIILGLPFRSDSRNDGGFYERAEHQDDRRFAKLDRAHMARTADISRKWTLTEVKSGDAVSNVHEMYVVRDAANLSRIWWPETGSNRRRRPFQGRLPDSLSGLKSTYVYVREELTGGAIQDDLGRFGLISGLRCTRMVRECISRRVSGIWKLASRTRKPCSIYLRMAFVDRSGGF
jgi:hypothetical protein